MSGQPKARKTPPGAQSSVPALVPVLPGGGTPQAGATAALRGPVRPRPAHGACMWRETARNELSATEAPAKHRTPAMRDQGLDHLAIQWDGMR
eukprot:scaffold470949_cov46-Prasinocladus_malaysianus.AAC.1